MFKLFEKKPEGKIIEKILNEKIKNSHCHSLGTATTGFTLIEFNFELMPLPQNSDYPQNIYGKLGNTIIYTDNNYICKKPVYLPFFCCEIKLVFKLEGHVQPKISEIEEHIIRKLGAYSVTLKKGIEVLKPLTEYTKEILVREYKVGELSLSDFLEQNRHVQNVSAFLDLYQPSPKCCEIELSLSNNSPFLLQ